MRNGTRNPLNQSCIRNILKGRKPFLNIAFNSKTENYYKCESKLKANCENQLTFVNEHPISQNENKLILILINFKKCLYFSIKFCENSTSNLMMVV